MNAFDIPKKSVKIPDNSDNVIIPSYETRKTKFEPITIPNYISKLNIIDNLMMDSMLSPDIKMKL